MSPKHGEWWWVNPYEGADARPMWYLEPRYGNDCWDDGGGHSQGPEGVTPICRIPKPDELVELRRQAYWQGVHDERAGGRGEGGL